MRSPHLAQAREDRAATVGEVFDMLADGRRPPAARSTGPRA
ncbi:hypothetical protein ABZ901_33950 [Actinacidiphila alni]